MVACSAYLNHRWTVNCIIEGLLLESTNERLWYHGAPSKCINTHTHTYTRAGRSTKICGIIYSSRAIISVSLDRTIASCFLFHEELDPILYYSQREFPCSLCKSYQVLHCRIIKIIYKLQVCKRKKMLFKYFCSSI